MIYERIKIYCETLTKEFHNIPSQRKHVLENIASYINTKANEDKPVQLVYICTHNSRRSQFGQVWAKVAGTYYKIPVHSFSGGTEATVFNTNAIHALKRIGFEIMIAQNGSNPVYHLKFDDQEKSIECFSKMYNHPVNPPSNFAAIMTCGDAEENCPFIPDVELRIATTYDDPKIYDNTPIQDAIYDERCRQIAREVFYVFSKIK